MAIEFYPTSKLIKITSGTSITALEIYNATMDWHDEQANIGYSIPMSAVGKAPLGGGVYTDSIFILQDGWKIKLYNGTYQFVVVGTVITDDGTSRTVPPDSGNVEVIFQVSSQGILTGSGVTQQDKEDIAHEVWDVHATGINVDTRINLIRRIEEGKWKIDVPNKQLVFYNENNVEIKRFNLFDKLGQPATENVYERAPTT